MVHDAVYILWSIIEVRKSQSILTYECNDCLNNATQVKNLHLTFDRQSSQDKTDVALVELIQFVGQRSVRFDPDVLKDIKSSQLNTTNVFMDSETLWNAYKIIYLGFLLLRYRIMQKQDMYCVANANGVQIAFPAERTRPTCYFLQTSNETKFICRLNVSKLIY